VSVWATKQSVVLLGTKEPKNFIHLLRVLTGRMCATVGRSKKNGRSFLLPLFTKEVLFFT
jgi:hypothetical protein